MKVASKRPGPERLPDVQEVAPGTGLRVQQPVVSVQTQPRPLRVWQADRWVSHASKARAHRQTALVGPLIVPQAGPRARVRSFVGCKGILCWGEVCSARTCP